MINSSVYYIQLSFTRLSGILKRIPQSHLLYMSFYSSLLGFGMITQAVFLDLIYK